MRFFHPFLAVAGLLALALSATTAHAQCVSLTTPGSAYTQNFDTLSNTSGSTTNNLTITGWFMTESGGGARDNEQYAVDTGASTTGDTYSYGAAGSTERALGQLRNGTLIPLFGACFTNNTGSTITNLAIAYTGEEWRLGAAGRTDQMNFEYSLNATDLVTGIWTNVAALNFVTPDIATTGVKNGNAAAARTALSSTITGLSIANSATFWIRWNDTDATGADDGLAVDDFSLTPNVVAPINLSINDVSLNEGNAGTTTFAFTVSLSAPAGAGGVTFDIATADGTATQPSDYTQKSLTSQTIPAGNSTYTFDVLVNGDTTPETNETFFVNVTNISNAIGTDTQGQGTIVNDDITKIHDVQGNGAASPLVGQTVTVEGVVTASFQGANKLKGFFLQEEDADADADPNTSEGIFIYCSTCPTAVAEGQRVKATGTVSEYNNTTEITASTAGAVVVTDTGNHLGEVTPAPITLPIVGDLDAFYEAREGMLVTFTDTLTVAEYFELARYGQIVLTQGGRPYQFTEQNAPSVSGYTTHLDTLARREIILDDDNDAQEWYLASSTPPGPADGYQYVFYPQANGGFSVGTQGVDFFRGGDLVSGLTGILQWSSPGFGSATWRIRPAATHPVAFTVANPRPDSPPAVGGAIKAVGMNLLNYFTTIDTTSSSSSGPCGPDHTQDCRGADSVAEINRQRERASIVICTLNADVYGFMELENTTPSDSITDLLSATNTRCGGTHPYAFVNTGGTLGTDAIRVQLIYRTGVLSPVGSPLVDLDPVHNRPPTAQTFDVVDTANPAFGKRFTVIANHFKSKGSCPGSGADADQGDGQSCWNATRTQQAARLLTWINGTVIPAAGDPDVLLLGDFNSYAKEDPVTTLVNGGYTDLESSRDPTTYSYLFSAELGHLDYAFSSTSLTPQVTGAAPWHINADEVDLLDYNDEVKDTGEATYEEKPDGSALTPPRVVFAPGTPYRASDHDPVLVGLFPTADLSITKTDGVTAATPGDSVTYTITAANAGPSNDSGATVADTFPAALTCTWTCAGAGSGTCTASGSGNINDTVNLPSGGSVTYTASCAVNASATGSMLSNTATVSASALVSDPNPVNNSATDIDTLTPQADLSVAKIGTPDPVTVDSNLTYTITVTNAGPSNAESVSLSDPLPTGTTFVSLSSPGGWSCSTPSVGAAGTVSCSASSLGVGSAVFTLTVRIGLSAGTGLSNTATVSSPTPDGNSGNESATATTTVTPLPTTAQGDAGGGLVTAARTGGTCTGFAPGSTTFTPAPTPLPSGITFPYGVFGFTAVCPSGGTLELTVTYPNSLPSGTQYWKYGPTSSNSAPHWYVLPATFAGNSVTFTITDGGLGDDVSPATDGFIVDQGGPGAPNLVSGAPGIPTLNEWVLLVLSTLLGGLVWQARRRTGRRVP